MLPTSVADHRSHQMRDSRIERDELEVGVGAGELRRAAPGSSKPASGRAKEAR
jgi:hypothetical protein